MSTLFKIRIELVAGPTVWARFEVCHPGQWEEKQAAEMEAARQRHQVKAQQQAVRPPYGSSRLPHGSRFDVAYDAVAERWAGTLTVPVEGGEPQVFTQSESGVFRLLRELDRAYREAEAARNGSST